jgi:hypothetical protein
MQVNKVEHYQIYRKLSAKGLIAVLVEQVRKERASVSRNTILLAFRNGATTPLRELIIHTGQSLLESSEVPPIEETVFS